MMDIRKLDIVCLFLVLLATAVGGYLSFRHAVERRNEIHREKEIFSKGLKDLKLAESNLQQLKTALAVTQQELNALNERVPVSNDMGRFLNQLDSFLKNRGMALITLQPLPIEQEKLYTKIPVRMTVKGPFTGIYRLVSDLETMDRVVVMDRLSITKGDGSSDCHADLTAGLFKR
jgi:Tfp pilus assembly protein PilO